MDLVPFVKLPAEKLRTNFQIMEDGNRLLKKWAVHLVGRRKLRIFRERILKGEFQDIIPPEDYQKIMLVHEIRMEMLHAFAPMITVRAKIWVARVGGDSELFKDVYQEANFAFEDALFGYLGEARKAKFITYTWRVIDRRLKRELENRRFELVPPAADGARELVRRYEEYQQLNNCHVTFDEFAEEMQLSKEERQVLLRALVTVVSETDFLTEQQESLSYDYTAYSTQSDEDVVEREVFNRELRHILHKCIEVAKLTDFQKELLEAACTQDNQGWKAQIAKKYGFSRTRAGQAFKEACDKVRKVYEKMSE